MVPVPRKPASIEAIAKNARSMRGDSSNSRFRFSQMKKKMSAGKTGGNGGGGNAEDDRMFDQDVGAFDFA